MQNLVKLPFIIVSCVGVHAATTAPFKARADERHLEGGILERMRIVARIPTAVKMGTWILGGIEGAAIILDRWDTSQTLASILSGKAKSTEFVLTPWSLLGCVLILTGAWIRRRCYRELGQMFTYDISIRKNHKLITTGPYSVVRHPSYAAALVMWSGLFLWYGTHGSWVRESGVLDKPLGLFSFGAFVMSNLTLCVGALTRTRHEDAMLRNVFGEHWERWSKKVPYRLLPWIY